MNYLKKIPRFKNYPLIVMVVNDSIKKNCLINLKKKGVSLIEFRADKCRKINLDYLKSQIIKIKASGLPVILTVRSIKEGGDLFIEDNIRKGIYESLIPDVDFIDIELSSKNIIQYLIKNAKKYRTGIILSYHNFKNTPDRAKFENIYKNAKIKGADIVKIAVQANRPEDLIKILQFTIDYRKKDVVTISMGESGLSSRIFFPIAGSLFTYTYLSKASAPGQYQFNEFIKLIEQIY